MKESNIINKFIELTEYWKLQCKLQHWNSCKANEHNILDKLYFDLIDYQDNIVEDYLGRNNQIIISNIGPISKEHIIRPADLIKDIVEWIQSEFYPFIENLPNYKGLLSETDAFLHKLHKYHYLLMMVQ